MSDETEWKTIRVPEHVYEAAKTHKETHDDTWGDVVAYYADGKLSEGNHPFGDDAKVNQTLTVEAEDMRPVIREEIVDAMSEVEINVTVDGDSDVSEGDVRNIVESKIDALKRELR